MTTTKKAQLGPWTEEENRAIVALYFTMLDDAQAGRSYSKAGYIRSARGENISYGPGFQGELTNRSKGSVEAKLMNCSAAHRDVSAESGGQAVTMDGYGYRALSNYQATLKVAMADELRRRELQGQVA